MHSAVEIVRRFRRTHALVIGDAMLDTYLEGTAARLCSEGPVPVVRKTTEHRVPGGAANTAANVRALGAEVDLLAVIGSDSAGMLLRSALTDRGVHATCLVEDEQASTLHKMRILADGQYVVRFDEGETRERAEAYAPRLVERLDEAYARADVVIVSDYCYGVLSDTLIARLCELRRSRRVPLIVDSKALRRFSLAGATVVTPNALEARLLVADDSGAQVAPSGQVAIGDMELVGRRLLTLLDAEHVALTLGEQGVLLLERDGPSSHIPAHPVAHPNDVGAGDSFCAALALALAQGTPVVEATRIGIDAAGIAVTKRWTAVASRQELLQRVSLREQAAGTHDRDALVEGELGLRRTMIRVKRQLDAERLAGRRIVFTNGVFDLLTAGHVEFLRQAKALGDVLVVGVNTDRGAVHRSGQRVPINAEQDRLALVAALDPVDHALLFDEATPSALIRALRPDIHVKGGDYADEELPEDAAVRAVGGRVVILPLAGSLSSKHVIERIVAQAGVAIEPESAAGGAQR